MKVNAAATNQRLAILFSRLQKKPGYLIDGLLLAAGISKRRPQPALCRVGRQRDNTVRNNGRRERLNGLVHTSNHSRLKLQFNSTRTDYPYTCMFVLYTFVAKKNFIFFRHTQSMIRFLFGQAKQAEACGSFVQRGSNQRPRLALLRSDGATESGHVDGRWRLNVNEEIDIES
jgi:hypothetical protein